MEIKANQNNQNPNAISDKGKIIKMFTVVGLDEKLITKYNLK